MLKHFLFLTLGKKIRAIFNIFVTVFQLNFYDFLIQDEPAEKKPKLEQSSGSGQTTTRILPGYSAGPSRSQIGIVCMF